MSDAERKDPAAIIMKLEGHFQPKRNAIYERYVFQCRVQGPDEEFDRFVDDLRQLSASCAYGELEDEMLRDRIVFGIKDGAPRSRLLREPDLTLDKAIDMVRSDEVSSKRLQRMEGETVNYANYSQTRRKPAPPCRYCGGYHQKGNCPAYGQTCKKCQKLHHFAKVCRANSKDNLRRNNPQQKESKRWTRQKNVHQLQTNNNESLSSDESVYTVFGRPQKAQYYTDIQVTDPKTDNHALISFQLDTGSSCSTLTMADYRKLSAGPLQPSDTKLTLYDLKSVIHPVGRVKLVCGVNGIRKKVHFEVVDDMPVSLLSGRACAALNLVHFNHECVHQLKSTETGLTQEVILTKYKDVFGGLGQLPGVYHIDIDKTVKPVQNNPRRVPVPLKSELRKKLDELKESGVIRRRHGRRR